ncbi:hypothetical protein [Rhizobium mongolense]
MIVLSDHGHITAHTPVSVADRLTRAGFSTGTAPDTNIDLVVVPGQVGALYLTSRTVANVSRLVDALTCEPWVGSIFTKGRNEVEGIAAGSLATSLVGADHERAPDVYFTFRADDSIDPFGLAGGTFYDNRRRPGLGVHGGLHPKELAAVGIVAGSAFRGSGLTSAVPSSICDIAPTLLHLLRIGQAPSMTGRILRETFADEGRPLPDHFEPVSESFETGLGHYRQILRRTRLDRSLYLDGADVFDTGQSEKSIEKEFA